MLVLGWVLNLPEDIQMLHDMISDGFQAVAVEERNIQLTICNQTVRTKTESCDLRWSPLLGDSGHDDVVLSGHFDRISGRDSEREPLLPVDVVARREELRNNFRILKILQPRDASVEEPDNDKNTTMYCGGVPNAGSDTLLTDECQLCSTWRTRAAVLSSISSTLFAICAGRLLSFVSSNSSSHSVLFFEKGFPIKSSFSCANNIGESNCHDLCVWSQSLIHSPTCVPDCTVTLASAACFRRSLHEHLCRLSFGARET